MVRNRTGNVSIFYLLVCGLSITLLVSSSCLASPVDTRQHFVFGKETTNRLIQTEITVVFPEPELWETQHQGIFQNRGIAQIERLAKEYVLTVSCGGIHRVFIHQNPKVNLEDYLGKFVQVRYTYGDVKRKQVKCIQTPCGPITERKILINHLEGIVGSEAARTQFEAQCGR